MKMKHHGVELNASFVAIVCFFFFACGTQDVERQAEMEALRQVREQHRIAHLNHDAELLVSSFADDFRNIQSGSVTQLSREESLGQFRSYFDQAEILTWKDIAPPLIRMSNDASMAYVIVQKRVVIRARNAASGSTQQESAFAWLETWEKQDGEWQLQTLASTRKSE